MDWCWLVDVGDVDPVLECIGGDVTIRGVFLTHAHYDHLYGINRLIDLFPQCVVYTSEAGVEGIYSDKLIFRNIMRFGCVQGGSCGVVCDGDRLSCFGQSF